MVLQNSTSSFTTLTENSLLPRPSFPKTETALVQNSWFRCAFFCSPPTSGLIRTNHVSRITATHRRSVRHREGLDDRRRGGETHACLFAFAFGTFLVNLFVGLVSSHGRGINCTTKLCAVDSTWPTNDQTKGLTGQTSLVNLCSGTYTRSSHPLFPSCNK